MHLCCAPNTFLYVSTYPLNLKLLEMWAWRGTSGVDCGAIIKHFEKYNIFIIVIIYLFLIREKNLHSVTTEVYVLNTGIVLRPFPSGKSKEAEIKRINKELANIRSKFKGDKALDGYSKKKYVCKLLFIFLLGHDIDFGHMEAVNLLSSNKYTEKQIVSLSLVILYVLLFCKFFLLSQIGNQ